MTRLGAGLSTVAEWKARERNGVDNSGSWRIISVHEGPRQQAATAVAWRAEPSQAAVGGGYV